MKKPTQQKKYSSMVKDEEMVWEMVYDPTLRTTNFVGLENNEVINKSSITLHCETILPYPPENKLVSNKVILFPSLPENYGNEMCVKYDNVVVFHNPSCQCFARDKIEDSISHLLILPRSGQS